MSKLRTIASSSVTWLTFAAFVAQAVIDELGDDFPQYIEPAGRAVAVLLGAVAIIRRVTPVPPDERGLT